MTAQDSLAEIIDDYRVSWAEADEVLARHDLDEAPDDPEYPSLRWVLVHVIEETARHLGHVDILRELLDGTTGE